ncbi:M28 family peptidase [Terriglobus sp.]|uniref:M28 family peptidase n=1 Tax=Terriglobus sp. TaxID=1889013 RepID=UPI003AFFC5BF
MRAGRVVLLASSLMLAAVAGAQQTTVPAAAQAEANSIDPERLRAHVKLLSSDAYEGRGPGQPGGEKTTAYLVEQFKRYGVQPAGDHGTFVQAVPLVGVMPVAAETHFRFVPQSGSKMTEPVILSFGSDFVVNNQTHTATADIDAPIVFVGHGIVAPEYGWDDYAGADVRGKVVLIVVNEPPSTDAKFFQSEALTYYGRWTYKFEEAGRHGAVGALIIHRTDLASYGWQVVQNSWSGEHSYLRGDPNARLEAASWIQHSVADKLLASVGMTADEAIAASDRRGFKAIALPVKLQAHVVSKVREYDSANVVGKVAGAAPGGAVLYTGHWDHFGIDRARQGDPVFHGANDNGTGTAIVLELARAFAEKKAVPPHDVYFAAVTAEEQGLLGSQYLGMHPPTPARDMQLDLNYDALLPVGDVRSATVHGAERTTVYPLVQALAAKEGLTLQPDQFPTAGHYYRSDHFSLARVGVPAFSVGEGTLFRDHDDAWGKQQEEQYTAERYHQPADRYEDSMDFRGDARMARFGFELGWLAMQQRGTTAWQPGDEFEAARKRSEGTR